MPHPIKKGLAIASATALVTGGLVSLTSGGAQAATATQETVAGNAAGYLSRQVAADGSVDAFGGPLRTALGLAVARKAKPAFDRALGNLEATPTDATQPNGDGKTDPGAAGLLSVVAVAGGQDPTSFGSDHTNLVTTITATQDAATGLYTFADSNAYSADLLDHSLALLGLHAAGVPSTDDSVAKAIALLTAQQCPGGGWEQKPRTDPATTACTAEDSNSTGYALQALAAYRGSFDKAKALTFLHSIQGTDGGFDAGYGPPSDVDSTGIVASALAVLGQDPAGSEWAKSGVTPVDLLISLASPRTASSTNDGGLCYQLPCSTHGPNPYGTEEGLTGLLAVGLPDGPVTFSSDAPRAAAPTTVAPSPSPSPSAAAATVTVAGPVACTIVVGAGLRIAVPHGCRPTKNPVVVKLRVPCRTVVTKGVKHATPKGCVPVKKKK